MAYAYYRAKNMPALSVPAAEHSTITAWGRNGEGDAYENILNRYDSGIVSVVSDSWDIYNACENIWGGRLLEKITANPNRTVVVRPDSGDMLEVVPECLRILGERFGYKINEKGYKVLPDYIRMIQGDGISRYSLVALIEKIIEKGWSLDNIVFGSGGGLIQDCNRDTLRFALKCNWVNINGILHDVYKQPVSDPMKNSKRGKIKLIRGPNGYETVPKASPGTDELLRVFYNGGTYNTTSFEEIRKRAELT